MATSRPDANRYDDFLDALNAASLSVTSSSVITSSRAAIANNVKFVAANKTIEVLDPDLDTVLLAINLTDGIVIYNPTVSDTGGTTVGGTINLTYDTTSMSDSDDIMVVYESRKDVTEEATLSEILHELRQQTKYLRKIYS